jgi:hypothetical protein
MALSRFAACVASRAANVGAACCFYLSRIHVMKPAKHRASQTSENISNRSMGRPRFRSPGPAIQTFFRRAIYPVADKAAPPKHVGPHSRT